MEKAMAPHSSTLAWKIPWTEEPGRLQSMGSWRVRHDWATALSLFTFMHWRRKWQPTPVFLSEESQGQGSLVGCRLGLHRVGHDWSDLAEAAAAASPGREELKDRRKKQWEKTSQGLPFISSVQFSSAAQSCPTLCDPMDCSMQGLPVHHELPESTQTHVHWVSDAIQPSHPLSSPSPLAFNLSQHQGLLKWVSTSHQVAKVLEFQLQH